MWINAMKGAELPLGAASVSVGVYVSQAREVISDLAALGAMVSVWMYVCWIGWRIVALRVKIRRGQFDEIEDD